jgi:hypothetical protein
VAGHRTTTFSAGSHVPAASLNTQQDRAHTLDLATATDAGAPTDTQGADWITYQSSDAGIPTGDVVTLDASDRDWRERILNATARFVTIAARRWGRADEHVGNDPASCNVRTALGVTGPGAYGAASAAVATGVPPVVASGSCPIALDVRADGEVWIFADPTDGSLKLYNDTTTPLHLDLLVMATGRAPDLSAPPPDLVPTLTEVLWLTPTTAAARPADPGAVIALHRATDTGAVTLWDGGAWRTIGLVSPLTTRGDLWVRDGSGDARLPVGGASEILGSDGTDPVYRALDEFMPSAQVSTTDDTWTTVVTITTDAVLAVVETHFSVVARKDDWSEGGAWRGYCAHRRYGGAYNAMGSVAWQPNFSENALLDVRVTEDASGVYIQVKGPPATDYRWQVKYLRNVLED